MIISPEEFNEWLEDNKNHDRSCGTCRACCHQLEIAFDDGRVKPSCANCPHVNPDTTSEQGCLLEDSKPSACRAYGCDFFHYGWFSRPYEPLPLLLETVSTVIKNYRVDNEEKQMVAFHIVTVGQLEKGAWRKNRSKVYRSAKHFGCGRFAFFVIPDNWTFGDKMDWESMFETNAPNMGIKMMACVKMMENAGRVEKEYQKRTGKHPSQVRKERHEDV
jgi:hypothetical protein